MGECGNTEDFETQSRTPEQQMGFVEIILFPIHQACIVIELQHMQSNVGMMCRVLINQGKSKAAHINHQDENTNNPRGEIFSFELNGWQLIHGNIE